MICVTILRTQHPFQIAGQFDPAFYVAMIRQLHEPNFEIVLRHNEYLHAAFDIAINTRNFRYIVGRTKFITSRLDSCRLIAGRPSKAIL